MNQRWPILLFTIYVLIHDPNGDRVGSYEGQSQATISALLAQAGFTFNFIDAQTYASFVLAHPTHVFTPSEQLTTVHLQAKSAGLGGIEANSELTRAVLLTILDQINVIRAALPTPLSPITPTQAKNAIGAKIDSGAAD